MLKRLPGQCCWPWMDGPQQVPPVLSCFAVLRCAVLPAGQHGRHTRWQQMGGGHTAGWVQAAGRRQSPARLRGVWRCSMPPLPAEPAGWRCTLHGPHLLVVLSALGVIADLQ